MTRDDILRMVHEAYQRGQSDLMESCKEAAVQAIAVAVADEREACAKVAEWEPCLTDTPHRIAAAIRARGNNDVV